MARTATAEPETAERDLTAYADKEPTDKMRWYHEWLTEQFPGVKFTLKQVALAVTLYPDFQRSDFNKEKTAEKRAARAAGNGASEPAATAPARGRGRTKPAGGKPAAGAKPAATGRGRGRGRSTARAGAGTGAEAPF